MSTNLKLFRIEGHEYVAETPDSAYATHMDGWRALVTLDGGFKPLVPVLVKDKATALEIGEALHNTLVGDFKTTTEQDAFGDENPSTQAAFYSGDWSAIQKSLDRAAAKGLFKHNVGRLGFVLQTSGPGYVKGPSYIKETPWAEEGFEETPSTETLEAELIKLREEIRRKDAEAATLRDHVRKACAEFGFSLDFKTEVGVKYLRDLALEARERVKKEGDGRCQD